MRCAVCAIYPFCSKTTKASDGCNEGIKRKLDSKCAINAQKGANK